ncbi:MAG: GNAT family N-acetyltransferase [Candidatus Heimdallarchaeota archaeon]|nr:MAG: GNAT family N-acetyltransferase [Candidatus Heimdallarchaeota archaeon]
MTYFRIAKEGDLPYIEKIIHEAYQPILEALSRPPGALESTEEKLRDAHRNNQLYGIYKVKEGLIGTFTLIPTNRKTVKISHFAIKPHFQNQGIGSMVLQELVKMIQFHMPKVNSIYLEIYSKIPSHYQFYKRFGFSKIGEKHIRGETILILSKSL